MSWAVKCYMCGKRRVLLYSLFKWHKKTINWYALPSKVNEEIKLCKECGEQVKFFIELRKVK